MKNVNKKYRLIQHNDYKAIVTLLVPGVKILNFQNISTCGRFIQRLKKMVSGQLSSPSESKEKVYSNTVF